MGMIDQLKRYAAEIDLRGFARVRFRLSPDLLRVVLSNQKQGESFGMVLDRLILGSSKRPELVDPGANARAIRKLAKREANRRAHLEKRLAKLGITLHGRTTPGDNA